MNEQYLPYPIVTPDRPFLRLHIGGVLTDIVTEGPTLIYIRRVGQSVDIGAYEPLEQIGNSFLVSFDGRLLAAPAGRYVAKIIYKGTVLGETQFVFEKPEMTVEGSDDV